MSTIPFVHLHVHSEYSLLDGATRICHLPKMAKERGMNAVAVTDHGNLHAVVEFYQEAKKANIKPIIGYEGYICADRYEKKDGKKNTDHVILLARNNVGYHNLIKLATRANLEGFYYNARLDHELLREYAEGLICLTACIGGEIPQLIINNNIDEARRRCSVYRELFGADGFYLELQDHNTPTNKIYPDQFIVNDVLRELSKELKIPLAATNDTHFNSRDDFDAHEVLVCIGMGKTVADHRKGNFSYSSEHFFKTPEEMADVFPRDMEALENTAKIAELCNVEIELDNPQLPRYEVPDGYDTNTYLREICQTKLDVVFADNEEKRTQAQERMDYELDIIQQKELSAYFLIVRDFLKWARDNGILVGIRGSGAGAITSYLTEICPLDPLEYGLWFERFLSVDRSTMPDIDCDFEDSRRSEVIDYVVNKYGADKVAQVATFGTLKARAAVKDAARAMDIPLQTADRLSKMIGNAKSLNAALEEIPQLKELYDTDQSVRVLIDMAKKLEDIARHFGTHAAAVVIGRDPLVDLAPLQRATEKNGGGIMTQWEYPKAEAAGLVKMDFLGLRTLTVLKDAMKFIDKNYGVQYNLDTMKLDDPKAYELMSKGITAGVFQLESVGMRNNLRKLRPDCITDVIAMVALYRPGPMAEIPRFIQGKHDKSTITYLHPSLEPILKETYGVLVYQEQVMAIGRDVAGLNMVDSNNLLNALRKKMLDKMAKLEPTFKAGVKETSGFNDTQADELWERLQEFAKYAFNKAHSACYAVVAYQTAFLKANYPVEFMTALLTSISDTKDKVSLYVAEARKMGIEVLPPDINKSEIGFSIEAGKIRFGLSAINGVGGAALEKLLVSRNEESEFVDLMDFCCRISSQACNRKVIEALVKSGTFDSLPGNRAQKLAILDQTMECSSLTARDKAAGQSSLFGEIAETANLTTPQMPDLPDLDENIKLEMEREALGLYVSSHPLYTCGDALDEYRTKAVEELSDLNDGDEVIVGGMLVGVKNFITKAGKQMAFLNLDDLTGNVEITVFADRLEKYGQYLNQDGIVLVKATVDLGGSKNNATVKDSDDDTEVEKAEAKLIAVAIAPVDDEDAIQQMQQASPRRGRGGNGFNGNGYGKNAAPAVAMQEYVPSFKRNNDDAPPPDPDAPCSISIDESIFPLDDLQNLFAILNSCKGQSPVQIEINTRGRRRRWQVNLTINKNMAEKMLNKLQGISVIVQ